MFRRNAISRESPVHQRQVGGLEPTVAREHVCGPDVISTAPVNGAREGARVEIMSVGCPQTADRASRSGQVPDYLSRNIPSASAPPLCYKRRDDFQASRSTRKGIARSKLTPYQWSSSVALIASQTTSAASAAASSAVLPRSTAPAKTDA